MDKQQFLALVEKFLAGKTSREEEQWLWSLYDSFQDNTAWDEELMGSRRLLEEKMLARLSARIRQGRKKNTTQLARLYGRKTVAAAAVLLLLAATGYLWLRHMRNTHPLPANTVAGHHNIVPGSNKALLVLANGERIELDSAREGILAKQANAVVSNSNGQLTYTGGANGRAAVFNTISTPRGGQYRLVLPDGSRVWLNAASSLRFPAVFAGNERKVELSGEAYFEVAANAQAPFIVTANNRSVEVLGTDFNVMAYPDEDYYAATLLSGAVKIKEGAHDIRLQPGEQARSTGDGIKVMATDVEEAVAWKNGLFMFNNENIRSVMRKLARWYDVEIEYRGNMDGKDFEGTISRSRDIGDVLRMLELTGIVHFKIEERRIIVMP